LKKSTKVIMRKHGIRVDRFIHNYIYFVFYQPYVRTALTAIELAARISWFKPFNRLIGAMFQRYHAKVLAPGDSIKIFRLKEDLSAVSEQNKRIIPYKYANKIIFQEPEAIAVMDCPCRKAMSPNEDVNCCIAVGRDISDFWLEHCEKYHVRKITQSEALEIVESFRKTGHITQAFFRVATGGATGVICSCHPDNCVSLRATAVNRKFGGDCSMSATSGYSVAIDGENCIACGECTKNCYTGALTIEGDKIIYNTHLCLGCGLCIELCPRDNLSLYLDNSKPLPLDIDLVKSKFLDTP